MPFVESIWNKHGLLGWKAIKYPTALDGSRSAYLISTQLEFESSEGLREALQDPETSKVFADLPNFTNSCNQEVMALIARSQMRDIVPNVSRIPRPVWAAGLGTIGGFMFLRWANSYLSKWGLNNNVKDNTWDWSREIVVVTGGSGGIGAKIVSSLANRNITVIILDVVEPHESQARNVFFYNVDITNVEDLQATAKRIRSEHGDPTVLINNAGTGSGRPILEIPTAQAQKVFNVNIVSHFLLIQEFLPSMVSRNHGHVVTMASTASFLTQGANVDYSCTKAAALSFHEGLGQELRFVYKAPSVRTTIVHPSWVRTAMIQRFLDKGLVNNAAIDPEDVAGAVVNQILSGYGAQIVLPPSLGWLSLFRGLPSWWQEKMRGWLTESYLQGIN
ncbi:NAD(P)-binding protein [Aspergillus affinis]|uniref:NAD(P)-binding protein n=1 Tax=Aspergillus affinis TaxID=1070780 RepID=UPI0022FE99E1|nr:NAD(P)-binding protein [Aspergillus affinis]KAI9038615.1 NAD(P)-binding protein [Aspergillus affinis]